MTQLTERFTLALDYARKAHIHQVRKGSGVPYLYHLLAVSSMVLEYGGNEDQAIAGLLHDVLEDCGEQHAAEIEVHFGPDVLRIVRDCTDASAGDKAEASSPQAKREAWRQRKLAYLAHLSRKPESSLLVGACDKLHNARAILADLEGEAGLDVFERFAAGQDGTLRYYASLAMQIAAGASGAGNPRLRDLVSALDRTVERMHAVAGRDTRELLD